MKSQPAAVLVIGSDTFSFLSVIRSLGRAGLRVHAAGCPAHGAALRSRYVHSAHPIRGFDVAGLLRLVERERFELVIPCDDFGSTALHSHRRQFDGLARLCLPNEEAFTICSDKEKTYDLAARLGVPLAAQRRVESAAEVEDVAAAFGWPLVMKPLSSVTVSRPGVRNPVRTVRSRAEIGAITGPTLVQQHFIGRGAGVEVLCFEGEVLTAFQHERVHEPMPGGGSSYRRSVPVSAALLAAVRALMQATRYTGVAMVEFKVNPRTGAWILIEINGRFWGSLPLSIAAGADFPLYLYELLIAGRRTFPQQFAAGVYARNWRIDVRWLARNALTDRSDPTLMTRPLAHVALEVLNLPREHSDSLTRDDPAPAFAEVFEAIRGTLQPLVPWRRVRATRALRDARRVLFVCKGNICRSPFAEHYLRRVAGAGVQTESAGYYPESGRSSPEHARLAARDFGVDLTAHRSRIMTEEEVDAADVIFVFDRDNENELRGWFPQAFHKVHYLGALDGWLHIPDPWGASVGSFVDVYRRIQRAVDRAGAILIPSRQADRLARTARDT